MAVDNVRLPEDVERGARGGPVFLTGIVSTDSGRETRMQRWSVSRMQWDIGYGIQNREDFQRVLRFFYARRGRFRGFRFRDWSDYEADDELIANANGVSTVYQLRKTYEDVVESYERAITHPVDTTVTVTVDGVDTDVTVNDETGGITFGAAPVAGAVIRWSGEFDVPVRFDTDSLELVLRHTDAGAIPSIPIVELRQ